jgi:hypothetical protein
MRGGRAAPPATPTWTPRVQDTPSVFRTAVGALCHRRDRRGDRQRRAGRSNEGGAGRAGVRGGDGSVLPGLREGRGVRAAAVPGRPRRRLPGVVLRRVWVRRGDRRGRGRGRDPRSPRRGLIRFRHPGSGIRFRHPGSGIRFRGRFCRPLSRSRRRRRSTRRRPGCQPPRCPAPRTSALRAPPGRAQPSPRDTAIRARP